MPVTTILNLRSGVSYALAPLLCFRKFHVTDIQNTRDQITRVKRSKGAWSNCVLFISFIFSGSPNECWLHTCDACVIATWRLGLQAPLVARNDSTLIITLRIMMMMMMVMMRIMFTSCNAQVMCENIKKLYSNTLHAFRPFFQKFFCF